MLKAIPILMILLLVAMASTAQLPGRSLGALQLLLQKSNDDTARVNLQLQLSQYFIFKPGRTNSELDSSFRYSNAASNLSNNLRYVKGQGESYLLLSKFFHAKNEAAKGMLYAGKAVKLFNNSMYQLDLGEAYFEQASYYVLSGTDLPERIRLIEQALLAFEKSGNREKVAHSYRELADLNQVAQHLPLALQQARLAVDLYDSIHYSKMYGIYDLLGTILLQVDDYKQALKYNLLAVQKIEEAQDSSLQLCTIYHRTAIILSELKQHEEAKGYYLKALAIAIRYNDSAYVLSVSNNIPLAYIQLNKPAESLDFLKRIETYYRNATLGEQIILKGNFMVAYHKLKNDKTAENFYQQMKSLSEKTNDPGELRLYHRYGINYLLETEQYAAASRCVVDFDKLCRQGARAKDWVNNYYWQFRVDSAQGNYIAAIKHFQQYTALKDSVSNQTTSRQIQQLNIEFQTEKKDQDIQLKEQSIALLTKESLINEASLKQTKTTRNIIIGGAGMLAVLLALGYNRYRLKQRTNSMLEEQQKDINKKNAALIQLVSEKEWLVKEIHHRVKNNFHIVMGLLGTQSGYLKNEEAKAAIAESQQRIHAMSLIHQKLYQSEDLSAINMPAYINELVEYLKDSSSIKNNIRFDLQIERIDLDISYSIPIGLILNEAITNTIKYAFPGKQDGIVKISLQHTGEDTLLLSIADNGIGIPEGFDFNNNSSMGMNLINGLSKDIGGVFSMERKQGTVVNISFHYDPDLLSNKA